MKNNEFYKMTAVLCAVVVLFTVVCAFTNLWAALLLFICGVILIAAFVVFTKRRYDKIAELNNYLSLVCSGKYDLDINDNTEGELSILKNNLYKVIVLLRSKNDMLNKDKQFLSDSLADISHQLKTPLTSMMLITELLQNEKDDGNRKDFIQIIQNQLDKMKWLITTLLKLSKLDAGTATFNMKLLSSRNIIEESLKPFLVSMDLKEISLEKDIEDFCFTGDENWTVEAIGNIIKNCLEHTENGGRLVVSSKETTIFNEIKIIDNGCGIKKEDLPHIFERFYHGKNSSQDSVGIGLALSKAVLMQENGSIEVKSEEGIGSEFSVRFYKFVV